MPYKAKGKCVYRKDTGKKIGCTKGSVKKYLAALHANVKDVNESEDLNWADEAANEVPEIRFDDLMVGDVISYAGSPEEKRRFPKGTPEARFNYEETLYHVLSFEDGTTWRNSYQEPEKYMICNLVRLDSNTGNFLPVSRQDIKFPRGLNKPIWSLIYRENVIDVLGESEEFNWLDTPELPEDTDLKVMQLSEGDLPKYDPISKIFFVSDGLLHMMDEKVKLKFTKYISDLAASMPENEPVPEFFVENELRKYLNEKFLLDPPLGPKTMNESEDLGDLNWADEINPLDFSYQGKELFFDIRELNREELGKLYNLLLPHMNKTGNFINHMGEEISWNNNTTCFQNLISIPSRGLSVKLINQKTYLIKDNIVIKSISLHCGINDNDYLPLEGAICCISGTYEDEPDTSNIIYINAKDIFDSPINESEWFEDVANEPIILKTEELEVGDVVIPTCFKEEEFIVTGKGTSVKLLHEPTHWVTLKRNTKTDTGGVFLEHDTEMGRNCRFTLVHRENLIEESEENDDLFWADEMLKSYDDYIDITDNLEELNNLKFGTILKVTGWQDHLDIDNYDCKIVDFGTKSGKSPRYLVKFKNVLYSDYDDPTHCGPYDREIGSRIEKDCDCKGNGVGKCWFLDLHNMDKVLLYPNRVDLVENKKIEKPLLTEGRYDTITRRVVKDIISFVTSKRIGSFSLPYDITDEFEYEQEGLSFSIDLDIKKNRGVKDFHLDAAVSDDKDENVIMVALFFGPDFSPKSYEKLFYRLQEVMRHEIEHLTQGGPNRIPDRPIYYGSTSDLKTVYGHHKNKIEVPALVHGFYRRAKIEKRPLDEIMIDDLDADIQKGLLSKKQAENLLTIWLDYAKKNLPAARYSK